MNVTRNEINNEMNRNFKAKSDLIKVDKLDLKAHRFVGNQLNAKQYANAVFFSVKRSILSTLKAGFIVLNFSKLSFICPGTIGGIIHSKPNDFEMQPS